MKKLEHKAEFMRQFWQCFELEKNDLVKVREELLAERVALSVLRSNVGDIKGSQTEKVLTANEFSASTNLREMTK